jgi:hypothetical protein
LKILAAMLGVLAHVQAEVPNISNYDHVVLLALYPDAPAIPFSLGMQILGTNVSIVHQRYGLWVGCLVGASDLIGHEMGHRLGMFHANSLSCTAEDGTPGGTPVPISDKCTSKVYGDPFSIMGASAISAPMCRQRLSRQVSAFHKVQIGILPTTNVKSITQSGDYFVNFMNVASPNPTAPMVLRFVLPGGLLAYYVDVRKTTGAFDSYPTGSPAVNGVAIFRNNSSFQQGYIVPDDTNLINAGNPADTSFSQAMLPVGASFRDAVGKITIKTLSINGSGAWVRFTKWLQ